MPGHGKATKAARHVMRKHIVNAKVHPLEIGPSLVVLLLAGHLPRPPAYALLPALDVVRRCAPHAKPATEPAHLIHLPTQEVNDVLRPRKDRDLSPMPDLGGKGVQQVVVLVVAVYEQRRPRAIVQPIDKELLLQGDRVVPHQPKVAAYN